MHFQHVRLLFDIVHSEDVQWLVSWIGHFQSFAVEEPFNKVVPDEIRNVYEVFSGVDNLMEENQFMQFYVTRYEVQG